MNKSSFAKLLVTPLLAVGGLAFCSGVLAAEWQVVPETSSVGFIGAQQGTKFSGRFQTFAAHINLDAADPTKGSIVGTVEPASVNTRDHERDAALLEKDWFNTKEFPEARFESQKIEKVADGYQASGQLTLKGQTKPAVLKFTFSSASAAAAQFAGTIMINRFDFNVGEGWNDTSWVAQEVSVEIKLDLKK